MGWICREEKTGACDGVYTSHADAVDMAEYHQDNWPGSKWEVVESTPMVIHEKSWKLPEIIRSLEATYGYCKLWPMGVQTHFEN
jgi:hypothetical protein